MSEPSPYVTIRLSRKRAEDLLEILRAARRSKTKPHRKAALHLSRLADVSPSNPAAFSLDSAADDIRAMKEPEQ